MTYTGINVVVVVVVVAEAASVNDTDVKSFILRNIHNLEDSGADGTILTRINRVGVESIHLAHGKNHPCERCNKFGPTK